MFFLTGMLPPGCMTRTELSITLRLSGGKKRLVTKPEGGKSTSSQSDFRMTTSLSCFFACLMMWPA